MKPEVAGLPERLLIVRQEFDEPDSWPPGEYRFSLNFQPASIPVLPSPIIQMKPGAKEFWRVANASSEAFLALQVVVAKIPQPVRLIALDGVPVRKSLDLKTIELPPGGRAEFIVTGPAAGQAARLMQTEFETGRTGLENPAQELAKITATNDAQVPPVLSPSASNLLSETGPTPRPTAVRKLYFAEAPNGTNGPTRFFLTVEGRKPRVFNATEPPAVVTKVGAVEDWIVANHSGEVHAFHMDRFHFLLLDVNGKRLLSPESRDTVIVPAWEGRGPFPTVKLRVDFRNPQTAGTSLFQCSVLHHAEAGMMGKVQVSP